MSPPTLLDDVARLAALRDSGLLDTLPQLALDRLTRLAARTLGTPVALVSLVTDNRQFFANQIGLAEPWASRRETPLSHSFCQHVVTSGEALVIDDATQHPLVRDNLAVSEIGVQAYAGVPLTLSDGRTLGSFCAIDTTPRHWTASELEILNDLAALACTEIESRVLATETAEAKRIAEESIRRFETTFEQAAVGIAHVALAGHWLRINARMAELTGFSLGELAAGNFLALLPPHLVPPDFVTRLVCQELRALQAEVPWSRPGMPDAFASITVSVAWKADGTADYLIVITKDITERKAAEAALRASESKLRETQAEILVRLAQAAELRDDDTGMHTYRVGELVARIATELQLPDAMVALLRQAAPLHDIGKIGVPDSVLLKEGPLDAQERAVIERHAVEGARILGGSDSPLTRLAESIALAHHERWDGTGYPNGLKGEDIPQAARIVAVADVFDALSQDRPYRRAWPVPQVVAHIQAASGTHFDPTIVDAFVRVMLQTSVAVGMSHSDIFPVPSVMQTAQPRSASSHPPQQYRVAVTN